MTEYASAVFENYCFFFIRRMEKAQLSAIFELLKQQSEKFDLCADLNEDDLKEQLTLYR